MKSISQIANDALMKISNGSFAFLPQLGISGLLNDFQYAWLKQLKITDYNFKMLDLARLFCNSENDTVFAMTNRRSINDIRRYFQKYLAANYKDDDRVILSLTYDKPRINAKWLPLTEYMESMKKKHAK